MKIGFIGLGIMGRPMAGHLQAAGNRLVLMQHRSPLPQELLDGGAEVCGCAREVAAGSDVIILMLPDTRRLRSCAAQSPTRSSECIHCSC